MSVNNPFFGANGNKTETTANTNNTVNQEQPNMNDQTQPRSSGIYSPFANLAQATRMGQVISKNSSSESFEAIRKALTDQVAKEPTSKEVIQIVAFPREQHTTLYFSVIATVRVMNKVLPGLPVGPSELITQLLIIEGSNDSPRALKIEGTHRGNSFELERTAEDANNDTTNNYVKKLLAQQFGIKQEVVRFIDPIIVPRSFNAEDEKLIRTLAADSSNAVNTVAIARHPDFQDWNVVETIGRGSDLRLPVTVELANDTFITDSLGNPIAGDLEVSVGVEFINRNRGRDHTEELTGAQAENNLCRTTVQMEFIPATTDLLRNDRRSRKDRDLEPQVAFVARANILNVNQALTCTEGGVLFAAASVAEIGRENKRSWAELYVPKRGDSSSVNFHDVGALNYEANIENARGNYGPKIDTTTSEFTPHELGRLLDLLVPRQLAVGIDCPSSGPTAWYTTPFAALARGSKAQQERAYNVIISSAIRLTDGHFDKFFDIGRDPILLNEGNRIWMGKWRDNQGKARDIREFTYLTVANLVGESNPDMIGEWVDTQLNTDIPEDRRMADNLQQLQALTGRNVELTGTALRVTYAGRFLDALVAGTKEAGIPLVSRGSDLGGRFEQRRTTASYMSGALISSGGFGRAGGVERRNFSNGWARNSSRY